MMLKFTGSLPFLLIWPSCAQNSVVLLPVRTHKHCWLLEYNSFFNTPRTFSWPIVSSSSEGSLGSRSLCISSAGQVIRHLMQKNMQTWDLAYLLSQSLCICCLNHWYLLSQSLYICCLNQVVPQPQHPVDSDPEPRSCSLACHRAACITGTTFARRRQLQVLRKNGKCGLSYPPIRMKTGLSISLKNACSDFEPCL